MTVANLIFLHELAQLIRLAQSSQYFKNKLFHCGIPLKTFLHRVLHSKLYVKHLLKQLSTLIGPKQIHLHPYNKVKSSSTSNIRENTFLLSMMTQTQQSSIKICTSSVTFKVNTMTKYTAISCLCFQTKCLLSELTLFSGARTLLFQQNGGTAMLTLQL